MSKFCSNCGNMLDDSALFCGKCGTKCETAQPEAAPQPAAAPQPVATPQPVAEVQPQAPVYAENNFQIEAAPAKKKSKLALWIALAVAVVAIGVAAFFIFGNSQPEYLEVLEKQARSTYAGDYSTLKDMAPDQYWNYLSSTHGKTADELINDFQQQFSSLTGGVDTSDIDVEFNLKEETALSENQISQINSYLTQKFGFADGSATEGYYSSVELTVEIQGQSNSVIQAGYFIKIDGKWYAPTINFSGDSISSIVFTQYDM